MRAMRAMWALGVLPWGLSPVWLTFALADAFSEVVAAADADAILAAAVPKATATAESIAAHSAAWRT